MMNVKISCRGLNFEVLSQHFPGRTEENQEHVSQGSRSSDRDFNLEPPEYGAGVLTTRPSCVARNNHGEGEPSTQFLRGTSVMTCLRVKCPLL
jgi:hypothetical protein